MPRVADIYSRPAGIDAVPNATIESVDYNANVADVEADLNLPRPIVAGGTGANSASAARTSLSVEASKQVVTNYDSMVWENGSFYSAAGATNAPTANAFTGIVYATDANNIVVEARDMTTGIGYMRKKSAGAWGSWSADSGSAAFVKKAGDTMTGDLTVSKVNPFVTLNKASGAGGSNSIGGQDAGRNRWVLQVGSGDTESGGNAGSNFAIYRYDDPGNLIGAGATFSINRATGAVVTNGDLSTTNGKLASYGFGGDASQGILYLNSAVNRYLHYNGSSFNFVGAPLNAVAGPVTASNGRLWGASDGTPIWLNTSTTTAGDLQIAKASALFILNATPGSPQITFSINSVVQSFINDNGGSINVFSNGSGANGMYIAHGASAWTAISDARLPYKRSARDITDSLPPLDGFRLYENEVNGSLELFAKAQEVAELFPHVVSRGDDDPDYVPNGPGDPRAWGVSYDRLGAVALAYIRQQEQRIAELLKRIEALEAK